MVGQWWADVLSDVVDGDVTVHDGPLEGDPAYRLVCFAGRGPGEVFVDDKKAVGVTQWRVREGIFVSTVMHAHASDDVLALPPRRAGRTRAAPSTIRYFPRSTDVDRASA